MCLSQAGKMVYSSLIFVILCLTGVGTFTDHWRDLYNGGDSNNDTTIGHIGLHGGCNMPGDLCKSYWDTTNHKYESTIRGFLFASMVLQFCAMGWVFLSCLAFCFHSRFMHALAGWSFLIFICLAIAIIIFLTSKEKTLSPDGYPNKINVKVGYSFDLIIASAALTAASIILGAMTSWLSDQPCC